MKVIIDIPKKEYDIIKNYKSFMPWAEGLIKKGVAIPEGATNGDMIKAIFPNAIIEINELGSMVHVKYDNHTCWVNYELEWWKAPYKKESEDK